MQALSKVIFYGKVILMKYIYPAVFTEVPAEEGGGYSISFPDWDGATMGKDLDDAYRMAEDFLGLACWDAEEDKEDLPIPSDPKTIKSSDNSFVAMVSADTLTYKQKMNNRTVKKTLSIPEWLNTMAVENNINFSGVLQEALKKRLGLIQ